MTFSLHMLHLQKAQYWLTLFILYSAFWWSVTPQHDAHRTWHYSYDSHQDEDDDKTRLSWHSAGSPCKPGGGGCCPGGQLLRLEQVQAEETHTALPPVQVSSSGSGFTTKHRYVISYGLSFFFFLLEQSSSSMCQIYNYVGLLLLLECSCVQVSESLHASR